MHRYRQVSTSNFHCVAWKEPSCNCNLLFKHASIQLCMECTGNSLPYTEEAKWERWSMRNALSTGELLYPHATIFESQHWCSWVRSLLVPLSRGKGSVQRRDSSCPDTHRAAAAALSASCPRLPEQGRRSSRSNLSSPPREDDRGECASWEPTASRGR